MAILSVQSHVVFGRVGNRAAVFPLERMGFEVWPLNTVQFSNHTGYGSWKGLIFPPEHIDDIWRGMSSLSLAGSCEAVLTGYLGDPETGRSVLKALKEIRGVHPEAVYCCDPVMGDIGRGMYVREGILDFFKNEAMPCASIMTPNQYEAQLLAEMPIKDVHDAIKACQNICSRGPSIVLITSFSGVSSTGMNVLKLEGNGGNEADSDCRSFTGGMFQCPEAVMKPRSDEKVTMLLYENGRAWIIETPKLAFDVSPNGGGDLVSALFLGHYLATRDPVSAFEGMAEGVFSVFEHTWRCDSRELAIIAAQNDLVTDRRRFLAQQFTI